MPLSKLYVEGALDVILMSCIVSTLPGNATVVESVGTKGSLRPRVREAREKQIEACYLRDRDFDTDPPAVVTEPTVDLRTSQGEVRGWRWCRHEIENYLLEPGVVAAATGWDQADFAAVLGRAARSLRFYTAARWAVGTARRALPPLYELCTRPVALKNPMKVPADLSEQASRDWAAQYVGEFRDEVTRQLADATIAANFVTWVQQLEAATDAHEVLLLHAGKDLLATLEPEIARKKLGNPVLFCNSIRDWILAHPAQALATLPEWTAFLRLLA
ncbi:MAG: hypothetical protein H0T76_10220 [Nannocystis sp.]|nr:hypothetical protein [Nannocystis sp.]MBA3546847.1 hypothetical protein [Nannocystis sp.]